MKKGNRACALGNGEWGMKNEGIEHGKREWRTENRMEKGEWRMKNVEWGMENGESLKYVIFQSGNL